MDYEKKYKEALERAEGVIEQNPLMEYLKKGIEYIFPELKESEDERIRKELIDAVQGLWDNDALPMPLSAKRKDAWIAWLEKQGEQKYIGKVKPKFKVGDKIYLKPEYRMPNDDTPIANTVKEIIGIDDELYRFKGAYIFIEDQDKYELVEQKSTDKDKVEHLIPQKGMYYTCIKDYYAADNTHLCVKGNVYKSTYNGYINDESYLSLSWTNSCAEKYFEPTKDDDWIVCEYNNIIGKSIQYKEFKEKVNQKFIENLKSQGLIPKLRLWTIQDAKGGDVLYSPCLGILWIFKSRDAVYCGYNPNYNNGSFCGEGHFERPTDAIPATKEQRDLLFKKMKEAGYEWDAEKKELKKISQRMISAEAKEAMYSNPAWSEEDEEFLRRAINAAKDIYPMTAKWLKSLKQRIGG